MRLPPDRLPIDVEEVGVWAVVDGTVDVLDFVSALLLVEELVDMLPEDLPQPASSSARPISAPSRTRVCRLFMALVSPGPILRSSLQAAARAP